MLSGKEDQLAWLKYRSASKERYCRRYLEFALAYATSGPDDLDRIESELPNLFEGMLIADQENLYSDVLDYAGVLCRPESGCLGIRGYWEDLYHLLNIAIRNAHLSAQKSELASLYQNLAVFFLKKDKLSQAEEEAKKALMIFQGLEGKRGETKVLGVLATIAKQRGDFEKARSDLQDLIPIFDSLHDLPSLAVTYNQLGRLEETAGNLKNAEEYYRKDFNIEKDLDNDRGMGLALWGLGNIAYFRGDFAIASKEYRRAHELLEPTGDKANLAGLMGQQANLLRKLGDFFAAEKTFHDVIRISQELGDPGLESMALFNLAVLYRQTRKMSDAIAFMERAAVVEEKAGIGDVQRTLQALEQLRAEFAQR